MHRSGQHVDGHKELIMAARAGLLSVLPSCGQRNDGIPSLWSVPSHTRQLAGSIQAWDTAQTQLSLLQKAQQRLKDLDLEAAKRREQLEPHVQLQAQLMMLSILQAQGGLLSGPTSGGHQLSQVASSGPAAQEAHVFPPSCRLQDNWPLAAAEISDPLPDSNLNVHLAQDTLRLLPALSPDSTVSHTSDSGTVSATPVAPQHQSAPSDLNICAQLSPEPLDPAAALPTGCPGASAAHICAAPGISADAAAALKCVSAEQGLLLQELTDILQRYAKRVGIGATVSSPAVSLSLPAQPDVSASCSPPCLGNGLAHSQIPWWDLLLHDLGLPLADQPSRASDGEQTPLGALGYLLQPQGNDPDISNPVSAERLITKERAASLERYRRKRSQRDAVPKVQYKGRKANADKRQRIKGRFIKKASEEGSRAGQSLSGVLPAADTIDSTHKQVLQPGIAAITASAAGPSDLELANQP